MSESEGRQSESPLVSDRGATTISTTVVSSIAGLAAQEVEGVHMGGGGSRAASGVLGSLTGSESKTSGISVDVGTTEVAIDLKMGVEYNKHILQTVEEVRRRITDQVESMTGLRIKELNATITDITFPEKEERRRLGSGRSTSEREDSPTDETGAASETQTTPVSQETSEPETEVTEEVEPTARTHTEGASGPVPEEDVSVEGRPLEEDEIAEVRPGDASTEERPTEEAPVADTRAEPDPPFAETETRTDEESPEEVETSAEAETSEEAETRTGDETLETTEIGTSEEEDAEARMMRRAEERARRRRRRNQDS